MKKEQLITTTDAHGFSSETKQYWLEDQDTRQHVEITYSHEKNNRPNRDFKRFEAGLKFGGKKWCDLSLSDIKADKNEVLRLKNISFEINRQQLAQLIENLTAIHLLMED